MYSSDYYTHNESSRSNLFPFVKVYIYENWKDIGYAKTTTSHTTNINSLENPSRPRYTTSNNSNRLEITDFIINVGTINQQGNSDIIQNFTGSSSGSLSIAREIDFITDINFDLQLNDPKNIFTILGYDFDGALADFEIIVGFKDNINNYNTSILIVGGSPHEEVIFRGKISNIVPTETSLTINLVDGMFEAINTQALIGEQIINEKIFYHDRFFLDEENNASTENISSIYGGWNLNLVKKEVEFNLRNLPVIPPQRDSFEPTVDIKIQREDPEIWQDTKTPTTSSLGLDYNDFYNSFQYDFIKGNYVEKIGQGDHFDFKNFTVDYDKGLLQFEIPPIRDPEGFIIAEYKTAYRYQHPSFLAEKLFNQLGYEKNNSGEHLNFKKDEIDPNYPGGSPDTEDFNHKIKSFLGQITPLEDGNTEGIKTIHYCTTDKLFYYYANKGIWRTDLNNFNEKLFGTTYDILQIDSLYLGDYSEHDNAKKLRLMMSYRNEYRYMFAPPPVKPIHTAMEGENKIDPDRPIRPMKDFVSNLSEKDLWKEDFTVSIGVRDLDGVTTSGTKMSTYFHFDGWIWEKDWDDLKQEFKEEERLIEMPETFYCHHTLGSEDKYIEKKPLNIKKILYKNNPYGSGWSSEFDSFDLTPAKFPFANTDFTTSNAERRYLMIWADIIESPSEMAIELGQESSTVDLSEIKREYIFFVRIDDGGYTPTFDNCLVDITLDDGSVINKQFDVQLAIFMPSVDTISTNLSGSETQEPDYTHLTDWGTNNGNLAHGLRKLEFRKMGNAFDNYIALNEPKFSRNTWANQIDVGTKENDQLNNNVQLENFGIAYRASSNDERWSHCSIYEHPYFLGNELTTNFVLHKGYDWYGNKNDVYLVAISIRTPAPYKKSFLDYKLTESTNPTDDMDGVGDNGIVGQYIYLTWFKISNYDWNLRLNFTINHPHREIKNSDENDGSPAGNELVYGVTSTSTVEPNSEPFYGLNWSRDATGWMIKGRASDETFSHLESTDLSTPFESDYDRYSTVLDRFFVIGGRNRCKRSSETFLGVDLCIDYEEIDNPALEGYSGPPPDPETHPPTVIRPSIYIFSGEHISKWIMNAGHEVWNTNKSFDALYPDGTDTNLDTQGYNILRRDTTWGETYGGITANQMPSWYPANETSGRTGRLFLKTWKTASNTVSYGYDGNMRLESAYWSESENFSSGKITSSNPGEWDDPNWTGGKYKCNVSSTGNYIKNQDNSFAYVPGNSHTILTGHYTMPWWDFSDLEGSAGLDTVITGKDFISANTSSFKYYLPSALWSNKTQKKIEINQVYGLTKMKGKQVFTFVGVNRNYEVFPTDNTTKKNLVVNSSVGGDKMYSHIKNEVMDYKEGGGIGKPHQPEQFFEGLTSVIYCLDLDHTYSTEVAEDWWWKKERLRPLSSLMPTLLHDAYFETLDAITNSYEQLRFKKDEKGSYIPLTTVFQDASLGLSKGYSAQAGERIAHESGRGEGTWISECAMAQTQISDHGRVGHDGSDYTYTTYKSKWERFSHMTASANDGEGFAFYPFKTDEFELNYGNFVEQALSVKDGFEYALQAMRGRFANEHVLNSILPKTSFEVGSNCCYLVGNYGEYLTTQQWLETAEHYKESDWLDTYGDNKQDSHGTLIYLPNNFSKASTGKLNTSKHFISKTKGYIHNVSSENVYKDFLTKPVYTNKIYREERLPREEVHFISGMSIGHKRIMQDLQFNRSGKKIKKEKWTNPLMFYRKYDINNFNWTVLSDYLKPRIPVANFSGKNIKDALQSLASVMDYEFGIRNGEPFFEPSYKIISPQTFYYTFEKHDGSNDGDPDDNFTTTNGTWISRFVNIGNEVGVVKDAFFCPEEMSFINGKYYFLRGELIFITKENWDNALLPDVYVESTVNPPANSPYPNDNTDLYDDDRWAWAYRHVENSVSKVKYIENKRNIVPTFSYAIPNTDPSKTIKRIKYTEDMLLFEIKSIFNDKNIIDIQEYGRTYDFQEFTDLHIHYAENKIYKLKIQGGQNYKKVLKKDIPYIDNKDWIKYLSKSIVRNINTKKYKINFTSKLIPSLKYGDYIAIHNTYLKVGDDNSSVTIPLVVFGQTETITDYQGYNNYELYRITSANHDIVNFTTVISAYTIDTSSVYITVDDGAMQNVEMQDLGDS